MKPSCRTPTSLMGVCHDLIVAFLFIWISFTTVAHGRGLFGCYTSMFNFGDSVTDTGNFIHNDHVHNINIGRLPYGETFFHHPTGRVTDGRVIIDFIAESMGIPLLRPYLGGGNDWSSGANFAYSGAAVLEKKFFSSKNLTVDESSDYNLARQIQWFKQMLPSICQDKADCRRAFRRSIFMLNMEAKDYLNGYVSWGTVEEIRSFKRPVIKGIREEIEVLIEHGASTIVVGAALPIGCYTVAIVLYQQYRSFNMSSGGTGTTTCVEWLNQLTEEHNSALRRELQKIQKAHPSTTIVYADFYTPAMAIFRSPLDFGFSNGAFNVCCGAGGGPFNFDRNALCEDGEVKTSCDDPSTFVSWDGSHLTEAANRIIADDFLKGFSASKCTRSSLLDESSPMAGITLDQSF